MIVKTFTWPDESATADFAARLVAQWCSLPSPLDMVLLLDGDLGAGKTTLVRHVLRALGVHGRIKSPTYAVVEPYDTALAPVWHFDFYRFNDPREWEDAGFRDLFASPGLKLVEWPEKAGPLLPVADWTLHVAVQDDDVRHVRIEAATSTGEHLLQALS